MGKTYIDTVKYLVYANVEIGGLVEKPDVVGAVFGQTEGLLGDDLDLRELQKNGRIGRIDVDLNPRGGKSVGKIKLPSSLDMVETCILAAALETVDRVGPCEARIAIDKIEDTRSVKRKGLVDRAKTLLKNMLIHEIPESKEISEQVRSEVKTAEVSEYGPEKLPAGPGLGDADAIIIVEGRADVINMLKNDISNVIGVGGANVAPSIAKICQEKEVTVFLDGDRGGDIILAELTRLCEIDFVARAPTGKEVEELTRKEIIKCLRSKVPYEPGSTGPGHEERQAQRYRPQMQMARAPEQRRENPVQMGSMGGDSRRYGQAQAPPVVPTSSMPYATRSGDMVSGRAQRLGSTLVAPISTEGSLVAQVSEGTAPHALVAPVNNEQASRMMETPSMSGISVPAVVAAPVEAMVAIPNSPALTSVPVQLLSVLDEMEGSLKARFYTADLTMLKEIPVRDMIRSLEGESGVWAVVFDGIITQRLADLAETKKAAVLIGVKLGNVFRKPQTVLLHTKQ